MDEVCSTSYVAERLGINRQSAARLVRDGRIPAVRVGRTWVVRVADLEEFAKTYAPGAGRPSKRWRRRERST